MQSGFPRPPPHPGFVLPPGVPGSGPYNSQITQPPFPPGGLPPPPPPPQFYPPPIPGMMPVMPMPSMPMPSIPTIPTMPVGMPIVRAPTQPPPGWKPTITSVEIASSSNLRQTLSFFIGNIPESIPDTVFTRAFEVCFNASIFHRDIYLLIS